MIRVLVHSRPRTLLLGPWTSSTGPLMLLAVGACGVRVTVKFCPHIWRADRLADDCVKAWPTGNLGRWCCRRQLVVLYFRVLLLRPPSSAHRAATAPKHRPFSTGEVYEAVCRFHGDSMLTKKEKYGSGCCLCQRPPQCSIHSTGFSLFFSYSLW